MFPQLQLLHCSTALLPDGWAHDVLIEMNGDRIKSVTNETPAPAACQQFRGTLIPGMANVHSHSFQRAMAGLAEHRGNSDDNFWVWRDAMYRFADRLDAEAVGVVAEQLYTELILNGYTSIGEFHYLHHAPGGEPYSNRAELSLQHCEAARNSGLRLTHLPVLYSRGGFDGRALTGGQQRFSNTADDLLDIRQTVNSACADEPLISTGVAFHSLRAVSSDQIEELLNSLASDGDSGSSSKTSCPIHIHVAEQTAEVDDCLGAHGARPVEWLLDRHPVDANWCLIHATHLTAAETEAIAERQAIVGLCPATEANLGDGIFSAVEFHRIGGRMAIGSDSHISTSPTEELRLLEYGQRLIHRQRNILGKQNRAVGRELYEQTARHGTAALGFSGGTITANSVADFVLLDDEHPLLAERTPDRQLDTYVFAGGRDMVKDVIVGGRHIVQDGKHPNQHAIDRRFREATKTIVSGL